MSLPSYETMLDAFGEITPEEPEMKEDLEAVARTMGFQVGEPEE